MITAEQSERLLGAAREVLANAYVPYSEFPVGAAVLAETGEVFTGANVENASYGLTMCAERVALFAATAAGARNLKAIAVTATKLKPVSPCGACRQVMSELLPPDAVVLLDAGQAPPLSTTVTALLPSAFSGSDLHSRSPKG